MLAETRRREIAELLQSTGVVTVAEVEERFGVSPMTARRDLAELERRGIVRRTHGGAVLPTISAHEDSFARRLDASADEKAQLAEAAVAMVSPRETLFLDSSTTTYYVARRLVETSMNVTVLTNSLPVMELLFSKGAPALDVIGIGGTLRRLTRSFVGPFAVRSVSGHFADRLFLSVKGLASNGMLTDADPLEAELKRAMIEQSEESVLLIDRSKLSIRGLSAIAPIATVSTVLAHGLDARQADSLRATGATVQVVSAPVGA